MRHFVVVASPGEEGVGIELDEETAERVATWISTDLFPYLVDISDSNSQTLDEWTNGDINSKALTERWRKKVEVNITVDPEN